MTVRGRTPNDICNDGQAGTPAFEIMELLAQKMGRRARPAAAAALRRQVRSIMENWEEAICRSLWQAAELPKTALRSRLPEILRGVADMLEAPSPEITAKVMHHASMHGLNRLVQDYSPADMMAEKMLLHVLALEAVEEALGRMLMHQENSALNLALDAALQHALLCFVRWGEYRYRMPAENEFKYLKFLRHDLYNNLNSINLQLELFIRKISGAGEFAEELKTLESLQKAIHHTAHGIGELRQHAGGQKPHSAAFHPVCILDLGNAVAAQFAEQAKSKGLTLVVDSPRDLVISSDYDLLILILQNLVGNGIKYSSSGTVTFQAEVNERIAPDRCLITVTDQGPGIAADKLPRIFEADWRGDTHGQDGDGLGLAIAAEAAALLGAELTVDSEVARGSSFRLSIPHSPGGAAT